MAHKGQARHKGAQEDLLFENSFEVTKEQLRQRGRLFGERSGKAGPWLAFVIQALFAAVAVMGVVLALLAPTGTNITLAVVFGMFASFYLVWSPLMRHNQFRARVRVKDGKKVVVPWIQTIKFGEGIMVDNGGILAKYSYEKVRFIEENEECFYLWFGIDNTHAVYKNAFTRGDAGEFRDFILERCTEKNELWSEQELNRRILKDQLPRVGMLALVAALLIAFLVFHLVTDTKG